MSTEFAISRFLVPLLAQQDQPAADTETQYTVTLQKRWFRLQVTLSGGDSNATTPILTCWCHGFLVDRDG